MRQNLVPSLGYEVVNYINSFGHNFLPKISKTTTKNLNEFLFLIPHYPKLMFVVKITYFKFQGTPNQCLFGNVGSEKCISKIVIPHCDQNRN